MMPLNVVLSFLTGPIGRALLIALLAVSSFTFGYVKGVSRESDRRDAIEAKRLVDEKEGLRKALQKTFDKAEQDRKAAEDATKSRDEWRSKSMETTKRLDALLSLQPVMTECKTDKQTIDELNKALRGEK